MVREKEGESGGNLYHATTKRTNPKHSNWCDRLDLVRKEENSEVKWHSIIGRVDGDRLEEGLRLPL
jgi:hypothetical protein